MVWQKLLMLVIQNILRNKKNFIFSSIGILVGVGMFTFFVSLGEGIRQGVLNRIYPINQIEVEPRTVSVLGIKEQLHDVPLTDDRVGHFAELPGVEAAYPKQRSKFQARLWGGESLFGKAMHTEAFFDGINPALVQEDLREAEIGLEGGEQPRRKRRALPCRRHSECGPGQECRGETCQDIRYYTLFQDFGEAVPCTEDRGCAAGAVCLGGGCRDEGCEPGSDTCGEGRVCSRVPCDGDARCGGSAGSCQAGFCAGGYCAPACEAPDRETGTLPSQEGCAPGQWCVGHACGTDADCGGDGACQGGHCAVPRMCERMPCGLTTWGDQYSERASVVRGFIPGLCADGSRPPADGTCDIPLQCPERTYCAPPTKTATTGFCEPPIPVILSPFLVEMFNTTAATALGLQRVSETEALLGLQFRIQYGDSFFMDDEDKERQVIKRAQIVGFSSKALDLGVTMPLRYVERSNARFRGRDVSGQYDSVILDASSNEAVHAVTAQAESMGFDLSRKSRDAKKAGNMLYILTLVFALISWIILTIAAINISHTFLMVIYERKRELGVLRSIGATRMDIRRLVLAEALLIGVVGGGVGCLLAWAGSAMVNAVAQRALSDLPFRPEDFFVFVPGYVVGSILMAIVFCLLGAFLPANRAARLDPAEVLSQA